MPSQSATPLVGGKAYVDGELGAGYFYLSALG
jgi:hypothetical protein